MVKTHEIIAYQKKQEELKKETKKIKETTPSYIVGFVFIMFLTVFAIESKVYSYFGGTLNFISVSVLFTLFTGLLYFYVSQKRIKEKKKLSKDIQSKLYHLMKLENE
ncbi:hypothetical protein [Polaribacter sp. IC073]|uniref:hypothetical protein n=1 Tax=Polaribacter sp. IC073 TaxID=2508540 RepID=UPI0011BDE344|nr:hypothetical protein [Polaribacter sp. IC073]TXD48895.1 hypothetical protein ES045_06640 [Polaribacter sp. IC073]